MTKSLVILVVVTILIQGGALSGSFQPAAGKGSDWKCIVASVLQHLLLWPGLFLWIWQGTLVVLLAYPSVCLAGFILQSMCLTGCVSVSDCGASSFPLRGKRTYEGHLAIHSIVQSKFSWLLPGHLHTIFHAHFRSLVTRTEIIMFLSWLTAFSRDSFFNVYYLFLI